MKDGVAVDGKATSAAGSTAAKVAKPEDKSSSFEAPAFPLKISIKDMKDMQATLAKNMSTANTTSAAPGAPPPTKDSDVVL